MNSQTHTSSSPSSRTGETARDPVCGMDVEMQAAKGTSKVEGQTFYFCSEACKTAFDRNPAAYASRPDNRQKPAM